MSKPILVLNCGSSSIKYQMIDAENEELLAKGLVQRIATGTVGTIDHEVLADEQGEFHVDQELPDHETALGTVFQLFRDHGPDLTATFAVAHRTVHGGDRFAAPTRIDNQVVKTLREVSPLAPLHNPPAIAGIEAARRVLPDVPHVAIFDTAFFATLPPEAYTYAVPRELAAEHGIRKYGFHGTSHSYVSKKAAEFLERPLTELKTIVCHLGNGASISAVDGGVAIDTSMGLTPLQGLVMGTRSGDVDPGLPKYLNVAARMSVSEVDTMLNKKSGMGGMCGYTDMRDIKTQIEEGNEQAQLALDVYVHRLVGYIGSYIAILGGVDALVFTAGVGENADHVRGPVIRRLEALGFELDESANLVRSKEPRDISTPESKVRVLVIPTNEELAMAEETLEVIGAEF